MGDSEAKQGAAAAVSDKLLLSNKGMTCSYLVGDGEAKIGAAAAVSDKSNKG